MANVSCGDLGLSTIVFEKDTEQGYITSEWVGDSDFVACTWDFLDWLHINHYEFIQGDIFIIGNYELMYWGDLVDYPCALLAQRVRCEPYFEIERDTALQEQ